ncbi:sulfurtransferase [Rugamonas apoptosis]|uniref:Sulfurtransferase n=1 Tax=Rugamonas apoptosis TaxID=2758570 RepID=A0A7W2F8L6_9BURK|nr:rhodanese-like domain-containing protein [Rugamonas apoptosis]MBA5687087.1 sulfurtransferase [Rugamonas apoptosis]
MKSDPHRNLSTPAFRPDLVRWRQLVTPAWLAAVLAGEPVAEAPPPDWRLFEVGCDGVAPFEQAHIPGAGYIDTNQLEQAPLWNKVCDQALLRQLLACGIRHDSTVVLYGRNNLAAARAAHLMLYAGVRDVRLLDGGYALWQAGGYSSVAGAPRRYPGVAHFGVPFPARPDYLIGISQARALLQQPDGALVSIRTWNEYIGKISGYSYIAARGDIPGALWGRAGNDDDVNSMSDFHQPDGSMKPASEICQLWREAGIDRQRRMAFYCGTGWRASLAFFYAWLMDWPHISVYDGGWCEWSGDPANAVVCRTGTS